MLSASGKANGTPVLVGDNIHLQNLYGGDGGYLDTNGAGCERNKYCVSTAKTPNRANVNTGTWKILSSNKQNGTSVLVNDDIYLQNLYGVTVVIQTPTVQAVKAIYIAYQPLLVKREPLVVVLIIGV